MSNATVTVVPIETSVAPSSGVMDSTDGGAAVVVKLQIRSPPSAMQPKSSAPPMVAV